MSANSPDKTDHQQFTVLRSDARICALLFALSFAFYCIGLGWGLPAANETWAADAIKPGAPLSVLYRSFVAEPWNSGWFWFKYPLGHVFVLGIFYAPYMAWQFLSGGISAPTSTYPYGMVDPEATLSALALIGRGVSAGMAAGTVVLAFACLRGFGRTTAICGAVLTALCYPVVFYAHTTNVEMAYVFWMMVALYGAVRILEDGESPLGWVLLATGAAMSLATKEISAGFFVGLPPVILGVYLYERRPLAGLVRGGLTAAVTFGIVFALATNALLNPAGLANRIGFLTHTLPEEVALKYAPYYFPIDLGGNRGLGVEFAQLKIAATRLWDSLGPFTSVFGLVGILVALRQRPAWTLLACGACLSFYFVSVRAMLSLSLRYVMPIAVVGCLFAAVALGSLLQARKRRGLCYAVAAAVLGFAAVYGMDVTRMLVADGRYQAEHWLDANAAGDRVEVYQRETYLPRFPASVTAQRAPFEERSAADVRRRDPDFILLSSAGASGVTVQYKTDWDAESNSGRAQEWIPAQISVTGKVMNYNRRETVEMLEALRGGRLGYTEAARFGVRPWIPRDLIQSLNPEIVIYQKEERMSDAN